MGYFKKQLDQPRRSRGPSEGTGHLEKIKGLRELDQALKQIPAAVRGEVRKKALRKAARVVKERAEGRAPVDTDGSGSTKDKPLADRFSVRMEKDVLKPTALVVNSAPHAHLIELGHWHVSHRGRVIKWTSAIPFLRPALAEKADEVQQILADEIEKALQKFGRAA